VLWVKGSGSDLATIQASGFTGLRQDEIVPLRERDAMSDEQMVAYLARCQLDPSMPRPSIETLLHAFTPAPHVDHTHPDAIGAIVGAVDGERLAEECFGADAVWIPYIRPGFALSKLVADAVAAKPSAKLVLLAKHGLVTWGATAVESYTATLDAINRAAAFVAERATGAPFGGPARPPLEQARRLDLLAEVLPALRGALSIDGPRVLQLDLSRLRWSSSAVATRTSSRRSALPARTTSCTPSAPAWVAFDPEREDAASCGSV
jgi:rhamnose utilization protein RhaD (predicted bifunctional aldolase and dehydrogenase)